MKKKANPTPKQASPAKKRVQAPKLEPLDVPALQQGLLQLADESYRDFHAKLVPNIEKSSIIGVRVPMLRKFVRGFSGTRRMSRLSWPCPPTTTTRRT